MVFDIININIRTFKNISGVQSKQMYSSTIPTLPVNYMNNIGIVISMISYCKIEQL